MPTAQAPQRTRSKRKVLLGIVTSNRMNKTIVVQVTRLVRHPKYNRVITQGASFMAHDERQEASVGDRVRIMETRPLSRHKRWRLVEIVKQASTAPPVPKAEIEQARPPGAKEPKTQQGQG